MSAGFSENIENRIMRYSLQLLRETIDICSTREEVRKSCIIPSASFSGALNPAKRIRTSLARNISHSKNKKSPGEQGYTFLIDNEKLTCYQELGANVIKRTSVWFTESQSHVIKISQRFDDTRLQEYDILKYLEKEQVSGTVRAIIATSVEHTGSTVRDKYDIFIMEYAGETLTDWLEKRELSPRQYVSGMLSLSKTIRDCDKLKIIHCDIKPDYTLQSK